MLLKGKLIILNPWNNLIVQVLNLYNLFSYNNFPELIYFFHNIQTYIYLRLIINFIYLTTAVIYQHYAATIVDQVVNIYVYTCLRHLQISIYKYISVGLLCSQKSGKSFINLITNNGPKLLPCGIPLNTELHSDNLPFNLTLCFVLHKKPYPRYCITINTVS